MWVFLSPGNEFVVGPFEPLKTPFTEKAIKRSIDMDDDHPALGIEELHVIYDFCLAPIHIQNCATDEMVAQQNPTFLINERGIRFPILRRCDENRIIINLHDFFPRDEFIGPAHAVFDINSNSIGKWLRQPKDQVSDFPDSLVDLSGANSTLEQLRKKEKLLVLVAMRRRFCFRLGTRYCHNNFNLLRAAKQFWKQH